MSSSRDAKSLGRRAGKNCTIASPGVIFSVFRGIMPAVPRITTGTIGAPVSAARKNAPFRNGNSRPSGDRVPSGKIVMCNPLRSAAAAAATLRTASSRECPRATGTYIPIRIAVPSSGIPISDFFSITLVIPGIAGNRIGGSRFETWLLMKMLGLDGTCSSPRTRTRIPAARTPKRIVAMPHRYIVSKLPRSADHGIPTSAAGPPRTTNTNNMRKAGNMLYLGRLQHRERLCLCVLHGRVRTRRQGRRQLVIDPAKAAVRENRDHISLAQPRRQRRHDRIGIRAQLRRYTSRFERPHHMLRLSRCPTGMASLLNTLATATASARARLSTNSCSNTLRRKVFDRGSSTAHSRRPAYASRSARSVSRIAVG